MNNQSKVSGLDVKSLISIGIFTALYFVMLGIGAFFSLMNPVMMFIGPLIGIMLSGPIFMLFFEKVRRPWALVILGFIIGALMMLGGRVWYCVLIAPLTALIGDLVARSGGYRNRVMNILGYAIFVLWTITPLSPILLDSKAFLGNVTASMGADYATRLGQIFSPWGMLFFAVCMFVSALVSGALGSLIVHKHFRNS